MKNGYQKIALAAVAALLLLTLACASGEARVHTAEAPAAEAEPAAAPATPAAPPRDTAPAQPARTASHAPARPAPPAPAPAPKTASKTVPAGTPLRVEFLDTVASDLNKPGDVFRARVAQDVQVDGIVSIPAGSIVTGTVTEAVGLKKIGGRAKLSLEFAGLELPRGGSHPIRAVYSAQGKSETKKDAATIGGAAVGGAVLGRMLSKNNKADATAVGAAVGAGAGTAIAAKTKGEEIVLGPGSSIDITLASAVAVQVRL